MSTAQLVSDPSQTPLSVEPPARRSRDLILWSILTALATSAIYLPLMVRYTLPEPGDRSDLTGHLALVRILLDSHRIPAPHFLYHLLVAVLYKIIPGLSLRTVGCLVVPLACQIALSLVVLAWLLKAAPSSLGWLRSPAFASIVSVLLIIAGPVSFWSWPVVFGGYLSPEPIHSPTYVLLRPLALLFFIAMAHQFDAARAGGLRSAVLLATLTLLNLLAKPSYLIALLPAAAVMVALNVVRWRRVGWLPITLSFAVAGIGLRWQYHIAYGGPPSGEMTSRIVYWPFVLAGGFRLIVLIRFIMAILFPVVVAAIYYKAVLRDPYLLLAWLAFLCAAYYAYFLVELGPRLKDGNFFWGAFAGLFVLYAASLRMVVREYSPAHVIRFGVSMLAFAFHVAGGVAYFLWGATSGRFQPH